MKVVITLVLNISLVSLFLAFCNLTIIYFMIYNLCGFKASIALKKIRPFLAFGMIILFAIAFYFFPGIPLFDFLIPFGMLVTTFIIIEKKNINLSRFEKVLTWLHYYVLTHALFIPLIVMINLFTIEGVPHQIITYSLGTSLVLLICQKLDLNRLLIFVLRRPLLKFLAFILAGLFFIFSITLDSLEYILEHRLLIPILLITILVGLFYLIKRIHQNTAIMPESYHDTKKLMLLLNIKAEEATSISELKTLLNESIELMDLQLPSPSSLAAETEEERFKNFIENIIESTKKAKNFNTNIISSIQFTGYCEGINIIKSTYMLGLLLEYILDTFTKKPIYVEVNSSPERVIARISCEYKFEKIHRHLERFLFEGDIIQSYINRSSNLLKLKSLVIAHNGKVIITREKKIREQADYLCICAIFKKEGDDLE